MPLYLLLQNLRQVFWSELLMMRSKIARFVNLPRAIHQHQRLCLGSWWRGAQSNRAADTCSLIKRLRSSLYQQFARSLL
jgi:hypothetical protein